MITQPPNRRFRIWISALVLLLCSVSARAAEPFKRRIGIHTQSPHNGVEETYSDIRAFVPFGQREGMLFLDGRLLLSSEGLSPGYNLGMGMRGYLEEFDTIWGANLFTDQRRTGFANYRQVGLGFELLFDWLEIRNNTYLPVGNQRSIVKTAPSGIIGDAAPLLVFEDNFLEFGWIYDHQSQIEQSLRGYDLEMGGRLFDDLLGTRTKVDGYVGIYGAKNPDLDDVTGVFTRLNVKPFDNLDINVGVQDDNFFGTRGTLGVTFYPGVLNQRWRSQLPSIDRRMNDPVTRRSGIMIARGTIGAPPAFIGTRLQNPDGSDLRIVHVDGAQASNGDGTFENPLNNVADINASSLPNDIVYLYANSVYDGQTTLTLQNGQRLLGEGNHYTHHVDTQQLGSIVLPNVRDIDGTAPVLMNSTDDAIQLANNSVVDNLSILNPVSGAGISGLDVSGVRIANTSITTTADNLYGVALDGASDVHMIDSNISTGGYDAYGIFTSGTSRITLDQSTISTSGDNAYGVAAFDTAFALIDNDSSITTSGFDADGITAQGNATITVDNGSSISTSGMLADGVYTTDFATALVDHGSSVFTSGLAAAGGYTTGNSSMKLDNASTIYTIGQSSSGTQSLNFSLVTLDNSSEIHTGGSAAYGIFIGHDATALVDHSSRVSTTGAYAHGVKLQDRATLFMYNGSLVTTGNGSAGLRIERNSAATVYDSQISSAQSFEVNVDVVRELTNPKIDFKRNQLEEGNGTVLLTNRTDASITVIGAEDKDAFAAANGIDAAQITEVKTTTYNP